MTIRRAAWSPMSVLPSLRPGERRCYVSPDHLYGLRRARGLRRPEDLDDLAGLPLGCTEAIERGWRRVPAHVAEALRDALDLALVDDLTGVGNVQPRGASS